MNMAGSVVFGSSHWSSALALIWFAMPNKQGENPRFLRFGLVQMLYPVTALTFLVMGAAALISALG